MPIFVHLRVKKGLLVTFVDCEYRTGMTIQFHASSEAVWLYLLLLLGNCRRPEARSHQ